MADNSVLQVAAPAADPIDQLDPREFILIKNARVHNLKNLSVALPRNKFIVVTGLSGSGKSSLAFDTLYAEGQRMYVESLSSYARQFLGRMDKPDVDYIRGISPAIAIEQKVSIKNNRSTVGTSTEIYDYLKLLFARVGRTHSPVSGEQVKKDNVADVVDYLMQLPADTRVMLLAPLLPSEVGRAMSKELDLLLQKGYSRVVVNGETAFIEDLLTEGRPEVQGEVFIMIDRAVIIPDDEDLTFRLADSVQTAFFEGHGSLVVSYQLSVVSEVVGSQLSVGSNQNGPTTDNQQLTTSLTTDNQQLTTKTFSDKFELDALTLAAAQCAAQAVEREVAQPHAVQVAQPVRDFRHQPLGHFGFVGRQIQRLEKLQRPAHGQQHQVSNALTGHRDVLRVFAQAGAAAVGAGGAAPIAALQHAVLDFVGLRAHPLKVVVEAVEVLVAFPEQGALGLAQLVVGAVNGEVEADAVFEQWLQPLTLLVGAPGRNGALIHGHALVRYHQVLVNAQHRPEPLAGLASAIRVVEGEKVDAWLLKRQPIQLEFVGKGFSCQLLVVSCQ